MTEALKEKVLPALAGMSLKQRGLKVLRQSAPRASGDEPPPRHDSGIDGQCSPR